MLVSSSSMPEENKSRSENLAAGARAPEFTLTAANREGGFSLVEALKRGPAILEFLRGTW